jgi:1-deoxy-D-xylulose-5-phosphate reductoisomerase
VLNAANEIVVEAFLQDQVSYLDIPRIVEAVLDRHTVQESPTLKELLAADVWAREEARVATKNGLSRATG